MKPISECESAIADLTEKIKSAKLAISQKQSEIEELKERNAKLVEASLHKERMPKSLGAQRQEIARLHLQIEELQGVQASLQERLVRAREEVRFAQLFEQAEVFKKSEEDFFANIQSVKACLTDIAGNIERLKALLQPLRSFNHPLHLLLPILQDLNGKASYEAFILRGELIQPNSRDNEFIDSTIRKYRTLRQEMPVLSADLNQLGPILGNQLSYISTQASELRHFRRREV